MLTVEQFQFMFAACGGDFQGEIIEKSMYNKPDKQIFALLLDRVEVRHFLVNLMEKKVYEGTLHKSVKDNEIFFGYLNFPVVSFENYQFQ